MNFQQMGQGGVDIGAWELALVKADTPDQHAGCNQTLFQGSGDTFGMFIAIIYTSWGGGESFEVS